jgi:hypothetical protein
MTYIGIQDCNAKQLMIVSDNIVEALNETVYNTKIELFVTRDCCNDIGGFIIEVLNNPALGITYDTTKLDVRVDPVSGKQAVYIFADALGGLPDGVYSVNIQTSSVEEGGSETDACAFLDCETKGMVCSNIDQLLNCDTDLFLMHYGLTIGDDCNCNCEALCELYDKLKEKLNADNVNNCKSC